MSREGESWYPLSGSNPVPGNPGEVRAAGHQYERVAAQIQAAATNLRSVADDFRQCSEAIDEVQDKARRVASKIERARQRYVAAGAALVTYASALEPAQQMAHEALRQAQRGAAAHDNAQAALLHLHQEDPNFPTRPAAETARQFEVARDGSDQGDRQVDEARATLATAVAMRDAAADTATAAIHAVVSTDGLHDGLWQNVGNGITEIWNGLGETSAKLSALALALFWFPGVGEFLGIADLIVATLLLVRDGFNLVTDFGTGKGDWGAVGIDALGVASFGVARIAAKGLNMAADGARAAKGARGAATGVKESGDVVEAAAKASAEASTRRSLRLKSVARADAKAATRSAKAKDLVGVLAPRAVLFDMGHGLSSPARMFQFPNGGPFNLHESRVPDNIFLQRANDLGSASWGQRYFVATGQNDVARDAWFLHDHEAFGTAARVSVSGVVGTKVGAGLLTGIDYSKAQN